MWLCGCSQELWHCECFSLHGHFFSTCTLFRDSIRVSPIQFVRISNKSHTKFFSPPDTTSHTLTLCCPVLAITCCNIFTHNKSHTPCVHLYCIFNSNILFHFLPSCSYSSILSINPSLHRHHQFRLNFHMRHTFTIFCQFQHLFHPLLLLHQTRQTQHATTTLS